MYNTFVWLVGENDLLNIISYISPVLMYICLLYIDHYLYQLNLYKVIEVRPGTTS